jgi:hypothetical protein
MMGLRGIDYETANARMLETYATDRTFVEEAVSHERQALHHRLDEIEIRIERTKQNLIAVERDQATLIQRQTDELKLQAEIADIEQRIRTLQSRAARQNLRKEILRLQSLEKEVRETTQAQLDAATLRAESEWAVRKEEIQKRVVALEKELTRIEEELQAAESRIRPLRDSYVTKTVAGFLIWVGYGSFAAIGSALAILLDNNELDRSPLAGIFAGFGRIDPARWPWFLLGLLAAVALVYLSLFGTDWALRKVDPQWRREARKKRHDEMTLPTIRIRRESYVQSIAALPYVIIGTLLLWFMSIGQPAVKTATRQSPPDTLASQLPGQQIPGKIVNAYLGTVIALLVTAVFVMYILKIVELRTKRYKLRWLEAWELTLIPLVLIGGIAVAIYAAGHGKTLWGILSLFMLLSCLAVAYGIVYRGMFKDVDRLRAERDRCLTGLYDLIGGPDAPALSEEEAARSRKSIDDYHQQWQELDWADRTDSDPFGELYEGENRAGFLSGLARLRSKKPTIPYGVMMALRVTDVEAAPSEVSELSEKRLDLSQIRSESQRLQTAIREAATWATPLTLAQMEIEKATFRQQASMLEAAHLTKVRELHAQHEVALSEFEAAYALGKLVKPLLDAEAPQPVPPPPPSSTSEDTTN